MTGISAGAAKPSPADLEHLPLFREPPDREAMAGRLVGDGSQQDRGHVFESSTTAKRGTDVDLVVVQQAEMKAPVGGEAHAVARAAVRLGHGADEPDHALCSGES